MWLAFYQTALLYHLDYAGINYQPLRPYIQPVTHSCPSLFHLVLTPTILHPPWDLQASDPTPKNVLSLFALDPIVQCLLLISCTHPAKTFPSLTQLPAYSTPAPEQ